MSEEFEKQIAEFEAAGNEVIGRPERVSGKFVLTFLKGKNSKIVFGNNCVLNTVSINVEQGNSQVFFGASTYIRGRYFVGTNSSVKIGDRTAMNRHVVFVATEGASIFLGQGCLLSDVNMSTTDWHSIIDTQTGARINPAKDIHIEDSVWIGEGVTIQKGVTVGSNSIIGAKSVVTKPVKPCTLVAGIPARIIKEGVSWKRELIPMDSLPADKY